jgi:hypothetical protein
MQTNNLEHFLKKYILFNQQMVIQKVNLFQKSLNLRKNKKLGTTKKNKLKLILINILRNMILMLQKRYALQSVERPIMMSFKMNSNKMH